MDPTDGQQDHRIARSACACPLQVFQRRLCVATLERVDTEAEERLHMARVGGVDARPQLLGLLPTTRRRRCSGRVHH